MSTNIVYDGRERIIIIGLTGRTGSGCTTVSKILSKEKFSDLDLRKSKLYDYANIEERKEFVVHKYMSSYDRWKAFDVIDMSSVILTCVFEQGYEKLYEYVNKMVEGKVDIISNTKNLVYLRKIVREACTYNLDKVDVRKMTPETIKKYYEYYMVIAKKNKDVFKNILKTKMLYKPIDKNLQRMKKYDLYTHLMQIFGRNLRSSNNPFDDRYVERRYRDFLKRINNLIKIINIFNENNGCKSTRICIDAIRNPYEAIYFRDKYRAFYLMAIKAEEYERLNRLKSFTVEEIESIDEWENHTPSDLNEIFYHQNIQSCVEVADIHVYNPEISNNKYYVLTEQIIKYVSLMIHPGLITPTHMERCMQLAFNSKLNSGCLSRQVGAVVTRGDYSVQSVGWNDVPKGQVSCIYRDVQGYCINKDSEMYSEYEIEDGRFEKALEAIDNETRDKLNGMCMSFCFKDIHNVIEDKKNQVHTRALHAEENAFLQISKYGGTGVQGGCLFTTASPCELCAKKAYQLGIKRIFYIDPYPGISKKHILTFGKTGNPEMVFFQGAIGSAYIDFYRPIVAIKDELELLTGVRVKNVVKTTIKDDE